MKQTNLEVKVGLFVMFGLLLLGALVVMFGRFENLFKKSYPLYVELPNAGGLLKNSQILYRGAKVGIVAGKPEISHDGGSVVIICHIDEGVLIDKASKFKIGANGLLGDRFVDVVPSVDPAGQTYLPGDRIQGEKSTGIGDIGDQVQPILKKLDSISAKISEELLTEEFVSDIHQTVKSAKTLVQRMDTVLAEAQKGKTPLGTVLYDRGTADQLKKMIADLSGLAYSLRKEGPLFYKDVSEQGEQDKAADDKAKASARKSGK